MTPERFRTIVDAYGADARRWPELERAAANAWADAHRSEADAVLAEAAQLDALLAKDVVEAPGPAFIERVIATAPVKAAAPRRPRWFTLPGRGSRRAGVWWSGAAFAGVGLIGGLAGAFAVSFFLVTGSPSMSSSSAGESSYLTTGFGGTAADWSGE
jgi:hypothetical protein